MHPFLHPTGCIVHCIIFNRISHKRTETLIQGFSPFLSAKRRILQKQSPPFCIVIISGFTNRDQYRLNGKGKICEVMTIDHPKIIKMQLSSRCREKIICKHIAAAYFTALPDETEKFYAEAMAYQEKEEKRQEKPSDNVCHYVWHVEKNELQKALLQLLFNGPE